MRNRHKGIRGEGQLERLDTLVRGFKTVIVFVKNWEAKEQAWRCHLMKHPEDRNADIKIFHFAPEENP